MRWTRIMIMSFVFGLTKREVFTMTDHYPFNKEKRLKRFYFWLGVTKWLHRRGWFRISKFTARQMK